MRPALLLLALLGLTGCGVVRSSAGMVPEWTRDWRQVATEADRTRLRD